MKDYYACTGCDEVTQYYNGEFCEKCIHHDCFFCEGNDWCISEYKKHVDTCRGKDCGKPEQLEVILERKTSKEQLEELLDRNDEDKRRLLFLQKQLEKQKNDN